MNLVNTVAPPKIKEILDKTTAFFRQKQLDTPRLDAELLIASTLSLRRIDLYLKFDQPLSEQELENCRAAVRRRSAGEPVAYILGYKEFFGHPFIVNSQVLIPRPETELLVEEVMNWVEKNKPPGAPLKILDVGTGTGCMALSFLRKWPEAQAWLLDISEGALGVARQNAEALGCLDRAHFLRGDAKAMSGEMRTEFDIIVANPPYIDPADDRIEAAVKKFEPSLALFAGEKGLAEIKGWLGAMASHATRPGIVAFEFGAGQGPEVQELFAAMKLFDEIRIIKDLAGQDRHAIGVRNGL